MQVFFNNLPCFFISSYDITRQFRQMAPVNARIIALAGEKAGTTVLFASLALHGGKVYTAAMHSRRGSSF